MSFVFYPLALLFGFVCVFLILLILIQKGRGGGLSSAFGGAGGNTAFGTKTGDMLTWVTSVVFLVFLVLSCGLIWTTDYMAGQAAAVAPVGVADDTLEGEETAAPNEPGSSFPDAPATPEPGIVPAADGAAEPGEQPE